MKTLWIAVTASATLMASALVITTTAAAGTAQSEIEFDESGKGAVLCIAMINASLKAYADTCAPDGHEDISSALGDSFDDIAKFSGENGDRSEAEYRAFIDGHYDLQVAQIAENKAQQCTSSEVSAFYAPFTKVSGDDVRAATAEMLSIPRKPMMNPCL